MSTNSYNYPIKYPQAFSELFYASEHVIMSNRITEYIPRRLEVSLGLLEVNPTNGIALTEKHGLTIVPDGADPTMSTESMLFASQYYAHRQSELNHSLLKNFVEHINEMMVGRFIWAAQEQAEAWVHLERDYHILAEEHQWVFPTEESNPMTTFRMNPVPDMFRPATMKQMTGIFDAIVSYASHPRTK